MTRIIIDGLRDRASLLEAISVVLATMNDDDAYVVDEHVFVPRTTTVPPATQPTAPGTVQDPFSPDPAVGLLSTTSVVPYVPCPRRLTHRRLTECWMCWCDVMRGAALEVEVIDPEVWTQDVAL